MGFAAAITGLIAVVAPGATQAQTANEIIHSLAPRAPEATQPSEQDDRAPAVRDYRAPLRDYHSGREYWRHYGPRVEGIDVDLEGQRARTYIDHARAIDLTVYFEFNSSRVTERARLMLDRLGEALNSSQLRPYRFLIAGHTDAVGGDDFNLELSYQRAEAVREYLAQVHGVPRYRLAVKGWGRTRLKDVDNPESGINRRVEVALIVDRGHYSQQDYQYQQYQHTGARPWFACPPGSRLIDPHRPDLDIDDFAAGSRAPMCRPLDD